MNNYDVELAISVTPTGERTVSTETVVFIPHLRKSVRVSIPSNFEEGQILRLRGLGKTAPDGQTGDLFLRINFIEGDSNSWQTTKEDRSKRKQEYEGKVVKCPACGENIPSFTAVCPACGHEFRGTHSSDAVSELASKLENAITDMKKVSLIRTFPIPNTREDILEFMILASTNIENSFQAELSEAWSVKFEQAYEKAKVLYGDLPEFDRCYDLFVRKKKEHSKVIKKKEYISRKKERALEYKKEAIRRREQSDKNKDRSSKFFEKNKDWIIVCGMFVAIFILIGSMSIPHKLKIYQLEKLIDQVEVCIADEDFVTARIKVNQIIDDSGWSTESELKYTNIRNSLLEEIDRKEVAVGNKIYIGASLESFKEKNYLEVVKQLKENGFQNIKTIPIEDLVTGWITSDGEIEDITINGESNFTENTAYSPDAEIVISYHTFKS